MAEDKIAPSFEDFAKAKRLTIRGRCWICALPPGLRKEVHHAWTLGFRHKAIRDYLDDSGYTCTVNQLAHHFGAEHPE